MLQIKSDVWQTSETMLQQKEEKVGENNVTVKQETEAMMEDDEKEEGEIKDDEDEDEEDGTQDDDISDRRSSSPNPVNLSLNTKSVEDRSSKQSESDNQVSNSGCASSYVTFLP